MKLELKEFREQYINELEGRISALKAEIKSVRKALRIEKTAQELESSSRRTAPER